MKTTPLLLLALGITALQPASAQAPRPVPAASTQTPPPGITIPDTDRETLQKAVDALAADIAALPPKAAPLLPDIQIFHKAVHDALAHNELYDLKQIPAAKALLEEGKRRADSLRNGQSPWTTATGLVVRGFRSRIDGSVQPYGMVIPATWQASDQKPRPLYSWCHGRGNNLTELAFLSERMKKTGEFAPADAFVVHVYGRFCNATKFAGETDFFESADAVRSHYPIDPQRWIAVGFSMGGASTWHLASHHASRFAAVGPGAGFAETAVYARVFDAGKEPPPWWEQVLWRLYDATAYAENLSNTHLVAYSGELDGQKQSADIMAEALKKEGLPMEHLIGPKTGHKYEPATKKQLDARLAEFATAGREPLPKSIRFTTHTLRYHRMDWLEIDALEKHWDRARIQADILENPANTGNSGPSLKISTTNIAAFSIALPASVPCPFKTAPSISLDGQPLTGPAPGTGWSAHFRKTDGRWTLAPSASTQGLAKVHGLTGPIDDAFMDGFLFVKPTGKPLNPTVGSWVDSEIKRALPQWRTVFRGDAPTKDDSAITDDDIASKNLVLWGDPSSNAILRKILPKLPLQWTTEKITMGKLSVSAADHAPVLIFPNPLNPKKYVVLNSSFTFREGSSVTNSQQTPKLPDWALIDLRTPPSLKAPGLVVDAGFFDEHWR